MDSDATNTFKKSRGPLTNLRYNAPVEINALQSETTELNCGAPNAVKLPFKSVMASKHHAGPKKGYSLLQRTKMTLCYDGTSEMT